MRSDRDIVGRLGTQGLSRVLDDVLDAGKLVRLANAVGLSYPGMRTQSQRRVKLVADLAAKAGSNDAAGKAVVRVLRKETAAATREWAALAPEARQSLIADPHLTSNGRLGSVMFAAASVDGDPEDLLGRLLGVPSGLGESPAAFVPPPPADEPAEREAQRHRKKTAELQKKIRYLEGQIAKTKDVEKTYKRDLMQRKGELAEARMLAERLRREVDELRQAKGGRDAAPHPPASTSADDELDRSVKRLAAEQRKLAHRLEKMLDAPPATTSLDPEALTPLAAALAELQKDVAALRRERRKDLADQSNRLDAMAAEIQAARAAAEASPKAARSGSRKKGEPERVGVFIDVQNMYYAARQLKGKLDFDALLAASVLDRRLIQATAYVVESKEIDQSGFIAMLQQRAIEVRRKTLKVRSDGSMKGDWDMEMALDILDMAAKLDVVVLVSGDGDFTSLVKRVKGMGPRVEVVAFPRSTAKSLLEAADRFHPLDRRAMIRTIDAGAPDADAPAKPEPPRVAAAAEPEPQAGIK